MGIAISILILIGLVKLLQATDSPLTCAVVYTITTAIIGVVFAMAKVNSLAEINWIIFLVAAGISFVLSFIYFWLLQKTEGSVFWWIILLGGFFIGFV